MSKNPKELEARAGKVKTRLSWCHSRNRTDWPEVPATLIGEFAVCECTETDKRQRTDFQVIHRGTGLAAVWAVTREHGITAARELMALPVNWHFRQWQPNADAIRAAHYVSILAIRLKAAAGKEFGFDTTPPRVSEGEPH